MPDDTIDAAQKAINDAALGTTAGAVTPPEMPAEPPPMPVEPPPMPVTPEPSVVVPAASTQVSPPPPPPPVSSSEQAVKNPAPAELTKEQMLNDLMQSAPTVSAPVVPAVVIPSDKSAKPKKKSKAGLIMVIITLLLTIPAGVFFVANQGGLADIRGHAIVAGACQCAFNSNGNNAPGCTCSNGTGSCPSGTHMKNDRCGETPAGGGGGSSTTQIVSCSLLNPPNVVQCGRTPDGCGGFCIAPVDKTCNQMLQQECNFTPTTGASCSLAAKAGFTKQCTCSGVPVWFDRTGVCNASDAPPGATNPSYYDTYGLCGVYNQGGCDPAQPPSGSPTVPSFNFTCNNNGCSTTDSRCTILHYTCDRNTDVGGGCQDGNPNPSNSASFNKNCGTEQIDVMCNGNSVAHRSKTYPNACGVTNPPDNTPTDVPPVCQNIKIYKGTTQVTALNTLKAGDEVILAVKGNLTPSKAHFRINGAAWLADTTTKNGSNEFTQTYTIPAGVTDFQIEGEVFTNGAWR